MFNVYKYIFSIYAKIICRFMGLRATSFFMPMDDFDFDNDEIALVFPGSSIVSHVNDIQNSQYKLAINMASALDANFDEILIERMDFTKFGDIQFELAKKYSSRNDVRVTVKNLWMGGGNLPVDRLKALGSKVRYLFDLPLRAWKGGDEGAINYLLNINYGFSTWKSSFFVTLMYAVSCGYKKITIYGLDGGGKYFWEVDGNYKLLDMGVKSICSTSVHGSEQGKIKASALIQAYINRIEILYGVSIRIVK